MLDLDAIFDPDTPLPAWSAGSRPSPAAPPAARAVDLPPDWHVQWDERAAILEYDGGFPRERAEAAALAEILREMEQARASLRGDA